MQQWFERRQKLEHDVTLKQQHYDQHIKVNQDLEADRQRLKQLSIFSEIRPHVFQQQQLLKHQQQLEPQISKQQQHFSNLTVQYEQEQARYHQAEKVLRQFQDFEQQHQAELNQVRKYVLERDSIAEKYKEIQSRLKQLEHTQQPLFSKQQQFEQQQQQLNDRLHQTTLQLDQSKQFMPLDQGLKAHIQQLSQFIQHYQKIEHSIGDIAAARQQLQLDEKTVKDLIERFGDVQQIEDQLQQQQLLKDQQLERLNQLESVQHKLQLFIQLKQELVQLQAELENTSQTQKKLETHTEATQQRYQHAKTEREQLQQMLQQQRLLHSENIEHLRAALKQGEACIVCGSIEHPYRDDESLVSKALYELHQQQEQQASQNEQQHFNEWQTTQQQLNQIQARFKELNSSCVRNQEKFNEQQHVLVQANQQLDISLNLTEAPSELTAQLQLVIEKNLVNKQKIEQDLQQLKQAQKQQQTLQQRIQNTQYQLQTIQQLQQQVQHIVQCLTDQEQQHWLKHSLTLAEKILHRLQERVQQLKTSEELQQQSDQLQQQLKQLIAEIGYNNKQLAELKQQLEHVRQQGLQNSENATHLVEQMTGKTAVKANEWLTQHEQQRHDLQKNYQQLKQGFEQLRLTFDQQKSELDRLNAHLEQNQKDLTQCQSQIEQWLNLHTAFKQQQFAELLVISTSEEQQLRIVLQQAERQLNEAHSALKTIQEQLAEHLQSQPEIALEQLKTQLQDTLSQLQSTGEQRDQYKVKLELHQQNLAKQQQYADQIQLIQQQEHRWSKISSLIGDAKGKEFRDLAQQYNLDILLEYANQQLAMLSQRYTLKRLENSLSLAIIDHDMDGEIRSVASLSGGESFLTALAISLAIANMASGSMKIESLFIDEGFGTLDASSLHMVMNALDQLQSQGRKVVLISHIQEMHERIPVQIQVQPIGSGSSRIEVVG